MNPELDAYGREFIRINIKKLEERHILKFKQMYSPQNLSENIDHVIDNMSTEKIDWAMHQVMNSLIKERIEIWSFRKTSTN
jgi:hypothetical protein